MSQEPNNHDVAAELVFDVSNTSEDVKFLGLVTGLDAPRNELTGLFDWTCRGCTFHNRSSTIVGPGQPFLARWLCTSCGRETLVRFRSRANAEWVVRHALAVAGATLDDAAGPAAAFPDRFPEARPSWRSGQRIFGFVAIPALLLIILLGLSDWRPLPSRVGRLFAGAEQQSALTPSSRLPGYWVSESGDHSLCFARIDPASKTGSYVTVSKSHQPCPAVRFTVVREETDGQELVIREIDEQGDTTGRPESVLYLPQRGAAMTRVTIAREHPVLTVYHRIR